MTTRNFTPELCAEFGVVLDRYASGDVPSPQAEVGLHEAMDHVCEHGQATKMLPEHLVIGLKSVFKEAVRDSGRR